jgi:hypothetical protein
MLLLGKRGRSHVLQTGTNALSPKHVCPISGFQYRNSVSVKLPNKVATDWHVSSACTRYVALQSEGRSMQTVPAETLEYSVPCNC